MNEVVSTRPRLHVVQTREPGAGIPDGAKVNPMRADWPRLLRDITCCGVMRLQLGNDCARLNSMAEPWSAGVQGQAAWLDGQGTAIAGLTDRWAHAAISQGPCSGHYTNLDIFDHVGRRLVRFSLTEDSNWTHFSTRLARQWAVHGTTSRPFGQDGCRRGLEQLQDHAGPGFAGTLHECWYDATRAHCPGGTVDASLLAPLLETLSEQVCPLSVVVGNRGLLQRYEIAFFDFRLQSSTLRLRSSVSELELDLDRIVTARIAGRYRSLDAPWLRLYDEQRNCVASLTLPAAAERVDQDLWQVLLRALLD